VSSHTHTHTHTYTHTGTGKLRPHLVPLKPLLHGQPPQPPPPPAATDLLPAELAAGQHNAALSQQVAASPATAALSLCSPGGQGDHTDALRAAPRESALACMPLQWTGSPARQGVGVNAAAQSHQEQRGQGGGPGRVLTAGSAGMAAGAEHADGSWGGQEGAQDANTEGLGQGPWVACVEEQGLRSENDGDEEEEDAEGAAYEEDIRRFHEAMHEAMAGEGGEAALGSPHDQQRSGKGPRPATPPPLSIHVLAVLASQVGAHALCPSLQALVCLASWVGVRGRACACVACHSAVLDGCARRYACPPALPMRLAGRGDLLRKPGWRRGQCLPRPVPCIVLPSSV